MVHFLGSGLGRWYFNRSQRTSILGWGGPIIPRCRVTGLRCFLGRGKPRWVWIVINSQVSLAQRVVLDLKTLQGTRIQDLGLILLSFTRV